MAEKRKNLEKKIILNLYDYIDESDAENISISETKKRLHNIVDIAIINYTNTITM